MVLRAQLLGIVLAAVALSAHPRAAIADEAMEAHIDPTTGTLVPAPAVPSSGGRAAGTSTPAPILQESEAPGGGTMVDLRGQFQHSIIVEQRADGSLQSDCVGTRRSGESPR